MSDNPPPSLAPESGAFALPGHGVVELRGVDAAKFAQAQFMSDVATLAPGHWHWSGWLTPKGRVIALFALLKLDAERLWLLLPDSDPELLATTLRRYVFRSKLAINSLSMCIEGQFSAPWQASGDRFAGHEEGEIELDMRGDGGPRRLFIGHADASEDARAIAQWDTADLAHGLPRLPASQAEQWTPQQLSLDRLHAYSVKKGCYPGQEIVARTHFLGQAKRGLVLFEADAPLVVGSEVRDGERAVGTVVSSVGGLALAVMPLQHDADAMLSIAGKILRGRPLLDGLERL